MSDTLSNFDIDQLLTNPQTGRQNKRYMGCFMSDELPPDGPEQGKMYVLNLGKSSNPETMNGTHWTCVFNGRNNSIIYFDPFGAPPSESILKWLKKTKVPGQSYRKPIVYNTIQLQDIDSSTCGYFCCYMLNRLCKGNSFLNVLMDGGMDHFKKYLNDRLVKKIQERNYFDRV